MIHSALGSYWRNAPTPQQFLLWPSPEQAKTPFLISAGRENGFPPVTIIKHCRFKSRRADPGFTVWEKWQLAVNPSTSQEQPREPQPSSRCRARCTKTFQKLTRKKKTKKQNPFNLGTVSGQGADFGNLFYIEGQGCDRTQGNIPKLLTPRVFIPSRRSCQAKILTKCPV